MCVAFPADRRASQLPLSPSTAWVSWWAGPGQGSWWCPRCLWVVIWWRLQPAPWLRRRSVSSCVSALSPSYRLNTEMMMMMMMIIISKIHNLKTLFNIVADRLKKTVELWCLCCIMMFRRVNKQPGMQKFWNWWSHYQEIYDWISPLNKRSGMPFILTQ